MDLRDTPKASIDHVWKEETYQVLALDGDTLEIMLDRDVVQHSDAIWFHEKNKFKF